MITMDGKTLAANENKIKRVKQWLNCIKNYKPKPAPVMEVTRAERFADEVRDQFTQWIEDNPGATAIERGVAHKAIIYRVAIEFSAK